MKDATYVEQKDVETRLLCTLCMLQLPTLHSVILITSVGFGTDIYLHPSAFIMLFSRLNIGAYVRL